ncbi:hypothetical protein H112_05886 [Trichophyton rubrum D6]|uniref:Kinetochore protein fta7 n=4 Tax=Trichophyton TaxID=5550 RepID=A0A178EQN7_TRIRU|nr:hypothetical protein H100_05901 [Trichophyton rubrum MR850]EZF40077.1 hypothetical protein H102_05870 [Trichophyton rubrum CBS 100081]EZF50703.1 hypothetical protein H103_05897 [Trichophyton rubrum CBS 288.86]EZF61322.1 hypothetical protein H104_05883 [Trichophyton rubrum CBS 289.86]EZF71944.1 hypothetical protein H105_05912 [Trichophyton soudanense CBS 452.61]EZF82727.1 hypothetical protein H110_05891 [Trichophyton rubrum MR1448]EZG04873.1 hypothetical protein H106_05733 [Trichophyton rub
MPPKRRQADSHEPASPPANTKRRKPNNAPFALKPRIRHINEETIKSKWTTLPDSTQEKVKLLFQSVELPVITRNRDEKKRVEAQSALATVRKNLGKRLPKMPFPAGTRDGSFDYEGALGESRALESQLAAATSSIRLLQAEIKREEAELAKDKLKLEELERNAKAAEAERKRLNKNVHPVLKQLDESSVEGAVSAEFRLEVKNEESLFSEIDTDPALLPTIKQLRNHLESMQGNAAQVRGIGHAISRAKAALDMLPLG